MYGLLRIPSRVLNETCNNSTSTNNNTNNRTSQWLVISQHKQPYAQLYGESTAPKQPRNRATNTNNWHAVYCGHVYECTGDMYLDMSTWHTRTCTRDIDTDMSMSMSLGQALALRPRLWQLGATRLQPRDIPEYGVPVPVPAALSVRHRGGKIFTSGQGAQLGHRRACRRCGVCTGRP